MKTIPWWLAATVLASLLLILAGCQMFGDHAEAIAAIRAMEQRGAITASEAQALMGALNKSLFDTILSNLFAAGLAYVGIQWRRGPIATPPERAARRAARKQLSS